MSLSRQLNLEYCITRNLVIYLGHLHSQDFEIRADLIGWKGNSQYIKDLVGNRIDVWENVKDICLYVI